MVVAFGQWSWENDSVQFGTLALKMIKTGISFDNELFNYHLTYIEIMLRNTNDNKTTITYSSLWTVCYDSTH